MVGCRSTLRTFLVVTVFLFTTFIGTAQSTLRGRVVYCGDTIGVPYANLYSTDLALGTVADSTGNFSLSLPPAALSEHVLTLSSVGFARSEYALATGAASSPVELCLSPISATAPPVTVTGKRFRQKKTYGNTSESRNIVSGWAVQARSGAERGTFIRLKPDRDHLLKEIGLHIAHSTYDSLRLRFHLYPVTGMEIAPQPTHSWLLQTSIEHGWIKVGIAEEVIDRERIFVSVEVIETWSRGEQDVLHLSAGLLTAGLYHRESKALSWQRAKAGLSLTVATLRE